MLQLLESKDKKHILTKKLPVDLDNRLYSMIHLIGGMEFRDVIRFANNASFDQVTELQQKVREFPSTIDEIMPYVGGFQYLRDSKEYNEILDIIFNPNSQNLYEDVEVEPDGLYSTDTNPYFTRYITPELKKILFKMWDKKGKPSYTDLKLLGVDSEELFKDSHFANVPDIIMPVLMIEWLGGIQNTEFAKDKSFTTWNKFTYSGAEPHSITFRLEPTGFDYSFDEQENFGDAGYSCWFLKIYIDKNSTVPRSYITSVSKDKLEWEGEDFGNERGRFIKITNLFPPEYLNKEMSYRDYTNPQMDLIELMWENYTDLACEYFCSFCRVEVVLV
jgi:hypothetical protein